MTTSSLEKKLNFVIRKPAFVPLFLLFISIITYGLLIPWLHLYVDDWIWIWTWEKMGAAGITKYFATHRPIWGLLFQISLPLFGQNILAYHVFALLIRWGSSLAFWKVMRLLFPGQPTIALSSAFLFLIYPGFSLQPIAITYSHLFLIYIVFFLSLTFNLLALRSRRYYSQYTALALLLSIANLLTMEYFFTLELCRPFLLWFLSQDYAERKPSQRLINSRLQWTLRTWLPYLSVFLGVGVLRAFIFKTMTQQRFQYTLPGQLIDQPFITLVNLVKTIAISFWEVTFGAWWPSILNLIQMNVRLLNSQFTLLLAGGTAVVVFVLFLFIFRQGANTSKGQLLSPTEDAVKPKNQTLSLIILGLLLIFAAGWPFWLTSLRVYPVHYNSRFTIPFMFGVVLLYAGVLERLRPVVLRAGLIAIAVGFAVAYHFQIANTFRIDWLYNRQLMWQIAWRLPQMEEGTTLLITDFPVTYYDTATMATELNSIYPVKKRFPDLAYYILYDREQDELFRPQGLRKGVKLEGSNITSEFHGSTSQVLSAEYNLSRCFRLLDPTFDSQDRTLADFTTRAVKISDWSWIHTDLPPVQPPANLFGEAPTNQWCYYFEKAELARQMGDWPTAARLGDEARQNGYQPRDEMEKLVFIEAYAHTGQWDRAMELTKSFQNKEKMPMLCLLWERIISGTPASAKKSASLQMLSESGYCPTIQPSDQ